MHGTHEVAAAPQSRLDHDLQKPIDIRYVLTHIHPLSLDEGLIDGLRRISNDSTQPLSARGDTTHAAKGTSIVYYYVVDAEGRLAGIISYQDIVALSLRAIVEKDDDIGLITVKSQLKPKAGATQIVRVQEPATMMDAYEAFMGNTFLAVPLVDAEGRFKACVSREAYDAVKSALFVSTEDKADRAETKAAEAEQGRLTAEEGRLNAEAERVETVKELQSAHGILPSAESEQTEIAEFTQRLVGLGLNLCHSVLTLIMLSHYEDLIQRATFLASLLPTFLVSSESLGGQANYLSNHKKWGELWFSGLCREAKIAAALAFICSLVVSVVVVFLHSYIAAGCIFFGMFFAMLKTAIVSHFLPAILRSVGIEPHLVSGSIVFAIADIATVALVFGITSCML